MRLACFALILAAASCAAPPPSQPAAWYSAYDDTIHYDDYWMHQTFVWYGQAGVDWIVAHEEGHRTVAHLERDGVDVAAMMPGATYWVRQEQAAQCEASATGHVQPWQWNQPEVDAGYWTCTDPWLSMVKAAG